MSDRLDPVALALMLLIWGLPDDTTVAALRAKICALKGSPRA